MVYVWPYKNCKMCEKQFTPTNNVQKYCNAVCRQISKYQKKPKINNNCKMCGKVYQSAYPFQAHCSDKCRRKFGQINRTKRVRNNNGRYLKYKLKDPERYDRVHKKWMEENKERLAEYPILFRSFGTTKVSPELKELVLLNYKLKTIIKEVKKDVEHRGNP